MCHNNNNNPWQRAKGNTGSGFDEMSPIFWLGIYLEVKI